MADERRIMGLGHGPWILPLGSTFSVSTKSVENNTQENSVKLHITKKLASNVRMPLLVSMMSKIPCSYLYYFNRVYDIYLLSEFESPDGFVRLRLCLDTYI